MTREQALQAIRTSFISMTGLPATEVWFADENKSRPATPHLWIRFREEDEEGWASSDDTSLEQAQSIVLEFEATGQNFIDGLKIFKSRLGRWDDTDGLALSAAGVALREVRVSTNVTALFRSGKEPRENLVMGFAYLYTATAPTPGEIETIVVDVSDGNTLNFTETYDVGSL